MLPDPLAAEIAERMRPLSPSVLRAGSAFGHPACFFGLAAAGYVVVVVLVLQLFSTTDLDDE